MKKIISVFLVIILGFGLIGCSGDSKEEVEFVDYQYGDIIVRENTVASEPFRMKEGIEVSINSQTRITKEELKKANQFNDASNEIVVLEITFTNNSKEVLAYNALGFKDYVTSNGVALKSFQLILEVLPTEFEQLDSFSAGDLMPGSHFTRIMESAVPDDDSIKILKYDYDGIRFTVELP